MLMNVIVKASATAAAAGLSAVYTHSGSHQYGAGKKRKKIEHFIELTGGRKQNRS